MLTMESERVGEAGQRGDYPRLGDVRQMIAPDIPALVERLRFAARYFSLVANAEALLSAAAALEHQQATIERLVAETCVDPTLNGPENRKTWAKKMSPAKVRTLLTAYQAKDAELQAVREERDEARWFAQGWHRAVEAILTIFGLSAALGASEAVEELRDHLQAAEARAQALADALVWMLNAIDHGSIDSPELRGDPENDIPPHKWHEEWAHHARAALNTAATRDRRAAGAESAARSAGGEG